MSWKLVLNENFPEPASKLLKDSGWDALCVGDFSAGAADTEVLARARQEKRCLVTFDTDYGELIFRRRLPPPPVVLLLRVASYRPADPAAWLTRLVESEHFDEGYFLVFDGNSLRRRPYVTA